MTKVAHLSSVHKADDVRIFHKECRSLAEAGYDVTLIARAEKDSEQDGVRIRAVRTSSTNRLLRMTGTVWRVLRIALGEDADIYHLHDPELIPVGLVLKARGKRVIYDVHEDVPGQIRTKQWIPFFARNSMAKAAAGAEWIGSQSFDAIIPATTSIAKHFPSSKTVVVQNFPLMDEVATTTTSDTYDSRHKRIVYTGALSVIRGAREMVNAMEILGLQGVRLTIAGVIRPASLEHELRALPGWRYVDFVGWQDRKTMATYVGQARVGIVLFHPAPNHRESQPNKLFEYMAAGLPVLASNFPFWEQFVLDTGAGLMVDPKKPREIAQAIEWLLGNSDEARVMGQRGREAVMERYSWRHESKILQAMYQSLSNV